MVLVRNMSAPQTNHHDATGEPTDNAKSFYEWLMSDQAKQIPPEVLKRTQFAVFGLGNSRSFPERYQAVGKQITSRLQNLGAQLAFPRGEGDGTFLVCC